MKRIAWIAVSFLTVLSVAQADTALPIKISPSMKVASHVLNQNQQRTLDAWLLKKPHYRIADSDECNCDKEIQMMRDGSRTGTPEPDFDPFCVVGDFNGDGSLDFAIVLDDLEDETSTHHMLAVFNDPFTGTPKDPAFVEYSLDMSSQSIFYSPQQEKGPKPIGFAVGAFGSDVGMRVVPEGHTYRHRRERIVPIDNTYSEDLSTGNSRFKIHGDEVFDSKTNLTWARCSVGQHWEIQGCQGKVKLFTWKQALEQGFEDWRVPEGDELASLLDPDQKELNKEVMIDTNAFPGMDDIHLTYRSKDMLVNFETGELFYWNDNAYLALRLVRGGK